MKNKPAYSLDSVDNALLLLQMLRSHGRVGVRQAAAELGIAPSTAHRLLTMLTYRDFARQDEDRRYVPGPGLSATAPARSSTDRLRRILLPHMESLCDRVDETVNLMVRFGTQARVLASVEGTRMLQVGDRQGTILPAAQASGGKALLARLSRAELAELYPIVQTRRKVDSGLTRVAFHRLVAELDGIRQRGFALNIEETEVGVCALGRCVQDSQGHPVAAISISVPTVRFTMGRTRVLEKELRFTIDRAEKDIPF